MQETKRAKDATDRALVEKTQALDEKTQALYHVHIPLADRELANGFADRAEALLYACPLEAPVGMALPQGPLPPQRPARTGHPLGNTGGFLFRRSTYRLPIRWGSRGRLGYGRRATTLDYRIPEVSDFLGVSLDGQRLVALDKVGRVKVWDATSGKERLTLDYPRDKRVLGVTWPRDGRYLATWSDDRRESISGSRTDQRFHTNGFSDASTAQIRDTATGVAIRTLPQTDGPLAFSPDGQRLAGVHGRDSVTVWAVNTGEEIRTFKTSDADPVESLAFSNQCLAVGNAHVSAASSSCGI